MTCIMVENIIMTMSTGTAEPQPIAAAHFELRGTPYFNNSEVVLSDIGESENALLCVTDNSNCCSEIRQGEFFFPDGSMVPISRTGGNFYRNRGSQLIRFNRRNDAMSPTGRYRCEIPDAGGNLVSIFINIGKKMIILMMFIANCTYN